MDKDSMEIFYTNTSYKYIYSSIYKLLSTFAN